MIDNEVLVNFLKDAPSPLGRPEEHADPVKAQLWMQEYIRWWNKVQVLLEANQ